MVIYISQEIRCNIGQLLSILRVPNGSYPTNGRPSQGFVLSIIVRKRQSGLYGGPRENIYSVFIQPILRDRPFCFCPAPRRQLHISSSSKLNVTPRTRTQFRSLVRLAQFLSPPGLSDSFSPTRKCHAAHDTALVRRWMNGVEPG